MNGTSCYMVVTAPIPLSSPNNLGGDYSGGFSPSQGALLSIMGEAQ